MKVLIIYNGINANEYALKSLMEHPEFKGKYIKGKWLSAYSDYYNVYTRRGLDGEAYYDYIFEIQTERFFDSVILNFCQRLLLIGVPFKWWDKVGDYFKAITNEKLMDKVRQCGLDLEYDLVRRYRNSLEIDCVAHSLGTLLALDSGIKFGKLILMGSPLTSRLWTVRKTARNFINKKIITTRSPEPLYLWSRKDIVCTKPIKGLLRIVDVECHCSHAIEGYIDEAVKQGILKG